MKFCPIRKMSTSVHIFRLAHITVQSGAQETRGGTIRETLLLPDFAMVGAVSEFVLWWLAAVSREDWGEADRERWR